MFSENEIHELKSDHHTSIKPFLLSNLDSTLKKEKGTWLFRKWNKEHFLQLENEEYSLVVNPILNIMIAKEMGSEKTLWNNTRGIIADVN